MKRILLTGMSATGKSMITAALAARGYAAIDLDSETWSQWVDAVDDAVPGTPVRPGRDWVWQEDKVGDLLAEGDREVLIVSGCSPNQGRFYRFFDAIVLLSAPPNVVMERLATRTGSHYGKGPGEPERVLALIAEVEPILRAGATHEIDTSGELSEILAKIVAIAEDGVIAGQD